MYTLKFQTWDTAHPLHKGTHREAAAKSIALQEGEKVWHQSFQVKTLAELEAWKEEFAWAAQHTTSYIPGENPWAQLEKMKDFKEELNARIQFEYMTFFDKEGELWKVIIFCCNCYIMNETGQTVDSIST